MSLTVCLLTRNEEKNIGRAILSVAKVADQILVVDTGSTDKTGQIAAGLAADVREFLWTDDFATARNFTLSHATGDWILWLNPDEELVADGVSKLAECLERTDVFAFGVVVQELPKADYPDLFTETHQIRLFRRRAEVRYAGRLHPHFITPIEELAHRENKQVVLSEITLRRHAYLSETTEPKLRWAAGLLELELKDRPNQLHYLIEYGQTLLLLRDPKSHEVFARAVDIIRPFLDQPTAPDSSVQLLLEYLMTVPSDQSRSKLSAEEARELALRWFPTSPPLLWRIARHHFQKADYRRSAELLEKLIELGRTHGYDKTQAFDPTIIGADAIKNLRACYAMMGKEKPTDRSPRAL